MKPVLPVLAGMAVIAAVAVAKHHRGDNGATLHLIRSVHHQYAPLTPAQKAAAVQLFKLKTLPSNGTPPVYTLTPQYPFSGPLGASLSASGGFYSSPQMNQIELGGLNGSAWVQAQLGSNSPSATYIATFNFTIVGPPITIYFTTGIMGSNSYTVNPYQPSATLSAGTYSIAIPMAPTYNTALIGMQVIIANALVLDSVTVQQY